MSFDMSINPRLLTNLIFISGEYDFKDGALGCYIMGEEVEVTIGEGDTIVSELLDSIVLSMLEGETCYIKSKIDPEGNKMTDFGIEKKSMKFNVTLKSLSRSADMADLEKDELLDRANHHKEKGTELYRADRTDFSLKRFDRAMTHIKAMEPVDDSLPEALRKRYEELKCQCYNNMAACYTKLEKFQDVVNMSTEAIECGGENVKALFRRGQAEAKLHHYDKAKADLMRALKLEPENKAVWNQLRAVEEAIKKEKQMYQKMFTS